MKKVNKFTVSVKGKQLKVLFYNPMEQQTENVLAINSLHHIHILDRSGSMKYHINELIDNVQKSFDIIGDDDYLSIIWFSSPGQYKTLIKGARKSDDIKHLLDSIRSVIGTTCFSDPLKETLSIIEDLKSICENFCITLFTDGLPVVPWGEREEEKRSKDVVAKISANVLAFNTIGYGYYYNQNFLKELSSMSQFGIFTHASTIEKYYSIFEENLAAVTGMVDVRTRIAACNTELLYLGPKTVSEGFAELVQKQRSKTKNHYFIITGNPEDVTINDESVQVAAEFVPEHIIQDFGYAYAYSLYYKGKRKQALDVLLSIGDRYLIDKQRQAFTFDEVADYTKDLKDCVFDPKNRMKTGKVSMNYIPADDAFCLMDFFDLLSQNNAMYVPFSKESETYSRISRKSVDEFNLFEAVDKEQILVPLDNFVYSSDKINLSIRFEIPGKVKLNPNDAKETNLPEKIDARLYRMHTFIKDGNLNIKKAVFCVPTPILLILENEGLKYNIIGYLANNDFKEAKTIPYVTIVADLATIPIINFQSVKNATIDHIYKQVKQEIALQAKQKYLNSFLKKVYDEKTALKKKGEFKDLTVQQIKVLEKHGISKDMVYNGIQLSKMKIEDADSYQTRIIEFYIKGMKKLPSIEELNKKISENKTLSAVFALMFLVKTTIEVEAESDGVDLNKSVAKTRDWLQSRLEGVRKELFKLRTELNCLKMAKILTGDWFDGLSDDGKGNYIYDGDDGVMVLRTAYKTEYC